MDHNLPDAVAGVKTATAALAFIGSAFSLRYTKDLTTAQAVTAVATGAVAAVCGAMLARHYAALPEQLEPAIAFFSGLFAMRLIPATMDMLVDNIKRVRFPWTPKE